MKKNILIGIFILCTVFQSLKSYSQTNFQIIFHLGATPLAGEDTVYLYAAIGYQNPSDHHQYGVGELVSPGSGIGRLTKIGTDIWGICIDTSTYFNQGPAGDVPPGSTIYNLDIEVLHNPDFSKTVQVNSLGAQIFFTMIPPPPQSNWIGTVDGAFQPCSLGIPEIQIANGSMTNYPNPLVENTKFLYTLKSAGKVSMKVYNAIGQSVKTLVNEFEAAGTHTLSWAGNNDSGRKLYNGVYYYTLAVDGKNIQTNKLIISR